MGYVRGRYYYPISRLVPKQGFEATEWECPKVENEEGKGLEQQVLSGTEHWVW